jgi:Kef-type K+ transport system membrane component KefB/mannitol/fructose-specific phosphotransferase system IIA component (Ntr-type)
MNGATVHPVHFPAELAGAARYDAGQPMDLSFLLQLGVLVLAARLGGALARAFRLPGVLGELAAGMIIGPAALGPLLGPAAVPALTGPDAAGGCLHGVIVLALAVLLFLTGIETDLRGLRRHTAATAAIGAAGTLAALAAAAGVAAGLAPALLPETAGLWQTPPVLFAAAAAAVTSVGLVARTLAHARRLDVPEGRVALAGAAVDNLLAVALLALAWDAAFTTANAGSPLRVAQAALKALAAGAVTAAACYVLARRADRAQDDGGDTTGTAVYGLGLALLAAGLFWHLGVWPLLGAYVLGLALSTAEIRHPIQERLEFVHAAFVPACFALVGATVDPALLVQPRVLLFALAFAAAALAAKAAGSAVPAWFAGLNGAGCLRVGAALLPRGEMTLVALLAALAAGALPPPLLAAVVLLLFVSGLAAPLAAALAFRRGGPGTRNGFPPSETARLHFRFPSVNAAGVVLGRLLAIFEDEGFSVTLLNRRGALYQLGRDGSALHVQRVESELVLTCDAADGELVRAAMLEVAASLEQSLRELREPLDAAVLRRRLQTEGRTVPPPAGPRPGLGPHLDAAPLRPRLRAGSRAGVIAELLDALCARGLVRDCEAAARAVLAREESMPTGRENGVAVPHGRTDAVDRLVCAVGLKPEGVEFGALDGQPARIVVLVLAPLHGAAPQLQFIALVSQTLNEQGRAALLACDTAEDMHAVLAGAPPRPAGRHTRPAALAALAWPSVALDLRARSREEALDQLLALCARSGAVNDPDEARRAVFARERECAAGIESGVALPHARTTAVDRLVCAFGICRDGVDFGAPDGQPARLLAMVLAPPSATADYARLMGVLTRAMDAEGRAALLAAKSSQEVLAVLANRGGG